MSRALEIIRAEHRGIADVLGVLEEVADRDDLSHPELDLVALILDYMEGFAETLHHPKEEDHLFVAVARCWPAARPVLERLEDEHVRAIELLEDLREAFALRTDGMAGADRFRGTVRRYADFQKRHIGREEREILPVAEKTLTADDWTPIDAAFAAHDDPLFGAARRERYEALHKRIVALRMPED
jgi:hemerythrin-like domain-containing protein